MPNVDPETPSNQLSTAYLQPLKFGAFKHRVSKEAVSFKHSAATDMTALSIPVGHTTGCAFASGMA